MIACLHPVLGWDLEKATARKMIEAHGGAIDLHSEPGRGTQFTVKPPVPARLPGDGGGD